MYAEPDRFPRNKLARRLMLELGLILFFSVVVVVIAAKIDLLTESKRSQGIMKNGSLMK